MKNCGVCRSDGEYDKLIDTKNADMKNIGGRHGGAIIAAQFLQRFVGDTPWAHLDVAGTAMGAPSHGIQPVLGFRLWRAAAGSDWFEDHFERLDPVEVNLYGTV